MTPCAHPGCDQEGTFGAPCDPHNLNKRQFFCQAHIKEFNKRWNGLNGFSEDEIFSMQHGAATWNRPTWKMGVGEATDKSTFQFETAEDLFQFFKQRRVQDARIDTSTAPEVLPADVQEACSIFDLKSPIAGRNLKQKYLQLVKKHHPDVNADRHQAEDAIKRINVAYKILADYTIQTNIAA